MPIRGLPPLALPVGPYVGMRDQPDPTAERDTLATYLLNLYTQQGELGTALVARPGFQRVTAFSGLGTPQGVYCHTALNGTAYNFLFLAGHVYRMTSPFAPAAGTIVDVTPVGPTISTTASISCCSLGDSLIVSDGVNKPWIASNLSGTPITGTVITAASGAWYGPPTVYYAKVFGILAAERSTIEWSEENDATTGYASGDFNNQWTLGQTGGEPLTALMGTNAALYYWRPTSIGMISGAVADDFVTSGVHDAVTTAVGTVSPSAIIDTPGGVFFLDISGRPHALEGTSVSDWPDRLVHETTRTLPDPSALPSAVGCYIPDTRLAFFGHPFTNGDNRTGLTFDPATRTCQGFWTFNGAVGALQFAVVGVIKDAPGKEAFCVLDQSGHVYLQFFESASQGDDYTNYSSPPVATTHRIITGPLGYDVALEKRFQRLDLAHRGDTSATAPVKVAYRTPRGDYGTDLSATIPLSPSARMDVHTAVGLNARGRWVMLRLTHDTSEGGRQFGFIAGRLEGVIVGNPAGVK